MDDATTIAARQEKHGYFMGHTENELKRLERQGNYLAELTRDLLVRAGVRTGSRVLDFGSGSGDTALLAAELVGPTGEVIGFDRAPAAVETANARAIARGFTHVRIACCDESNLEALANGRPFDVAIGRLVLMHQKEPVAILRKLISVVRPGGFIAFHELDLSAAHWASPHLPLLEKTWGWMGAVASHGGLPVDMCRHLLHAFRAVGLKNVSIREEGKIEGGAEAGAYEYLAETARSLLPALERFGLGRAAEVEIDTLAARLRDEAVSADAALIAVHFVAACGRIPG